MKITVNCPNCRSPLELERPAVPVEVSCPACTNSLTIDPDQIPPKNQSPAMPTKDKGTVSGWVIAGYIFAVLGGYLGIGIAVFVLMGDNKTKKHGIAVLVMSLFFMVLWKSMLK